MFSIRDLARLVHSDAEKEKTDPHPGEPTVLARGSPREWLNTAHWPQLAARLDRSPDAFMALLRVYLGIGLFVKALYFLSNAEVLAALVSAAGDWWFAPVIVAHFVIMAHFVCGPLLAAGLLTRWAALIQVPILMGAVFFVHLPKMLAVDSRQSFEFSALVLLLLCLFAIFGGGKWSMDAWMERSPAPETHDEHHPIPAHT